MKEITLPLNSELATRRLIGAQGGAPELPNNLVLGDQLTCQLRLFERVGDSSTLTERVPVVRSLRASLGKPLQSPTGGTFRLTYGPEADPATASFTVLGNLYARRVTIREPAFGPTIFEASVIGEVFADLEESVDALRALDPTEAHFRIEIIGPNVVVTVTEPGAHTLELQWEDADHASGNASDDGSNPLQTVDIAFNANVGQMSAALTPTGEVSTVSKPIESTWLIKTTRSDKLDAWEPVGVKNTLEPESFVRVRAFKQGGSWWVEIRLIQTPLAFTDIHERVLPPPPSIARIQGGGSGSSTDDIEVNEIQALTIPEQFRGTYVLGFDLRQTDLLGVDDGPEEIAAALNAMWKDGKTRFAVTNPEAQVAYIEFVGPLADSAQGLITATVKSFPPGVITFTLDLNTSALAAALRAVTDVTVPLEVELEVVPDGEDPEDPEVAGKRLTAFQHNIKVSREGIFDELATIPAINWQRPPQPRSYIPFTPDQIITGSQHYIATIGTGVANPVVVDHNLGTSAAHVAIRENAAGGRLLQAGLDYQLDFTSDNSLTLTFADPPALNSLVVLVTTAGPVSVFQAHSHTIGQVVGLQDALDLIGARLTAIEDMLPTVTPSIPSTPGGTVLEFTIPEKIEVYPGKFPSDFNPANPVSLPRPPALLPAIHDAAVTAFNALPLPVASANEGSVYQNTIDAGVLLPGGLGRRSVTVPDNGYFGSDGRILYQLTKSGATNSFFPTDFERELFALPINDKMLRAGQALTLSFDLELNLLKATTRAQMLLVIEVGTVPSEAAPAPTADNLENVVWNIAAPVLSQRIILSELKLKHQFGAGVRRSTLGVLSADRLVYGQWEGGATAPASANFAIRARLIAFDTENSVTNERGFVFYAFKNAKAAIQ